MSDFVIFTDSSADLSAQLVEQLGVMVLPLSFTIQGRTYYNYPDNRDMDPALFYDMLRAGELASTSAINVGDYTQAMEPVLEQEKDILILSFSSGLSATYNSSMIAVEEMREKYPQRTIYTVDTMCASVGQGLLVYLAAQLKKEGQSIDQVREWVECNKGRVCHQFTVNDLHFLKRGGRISATTAMVGSMLQIKPLLHVDEEGKLTSVGKARGRQASLKALVDKMEQTLAEDGKKIVFISHGDCLADAGTVAAMVRERLGVEEVRINYVGPVIGAHSGPGTLALCYLGTSR